MTAPTPIAQGDLSQKPLAHVMLSIFDREFSGTLVVWPDDEGQAGQDRLLFRRGHIIAGRLVEPATDLSRGMLALFHRTNAPFAFYDQDLVTGMEGVLFTSDHVYALIAAAARGGARRDVMESVLGRLREPAYRLVRTIDINALGLIPKEQAVVELVQASQHSISDWVQMSGDPRVATRTLYLLAITRCLAPAPVRQDDYTGELSSSSAFPSFAPPSQTSRPAGARFSDMPSLDSMPPPGAPAPAEAAPARTSMVSGPAGPPNPPAGLSSAHETLWRDVQSRFAAIDTENYFQMLGVDNTVLDDAISDGYVDRIKRFHPDRLPAELAPLRQYVDTIFRHLTEAKNTLLDPEKRKAHFKAVQGGGGSPAADRKLAAILTAALEFEKAEVLVRRKEWAQAIALLDKSMDLSPDEPDYPAMKAWVLLQRDTESPREVIIQLAQRALAQNDKHEQALLTLAFLYKRVGDTPNAVKHFERIVELNPKHVDAARELRLARMRGQTSGPAAEEKPASVLSKLFGAKKK
ncbi:MAG: DnaJ domain-containing protein [Sandaracinaceae bacterium]|nr:DnaJ domain-containing protein [Sandaracinaceae bacterium]MBP7682438.1 DnaJ domain-containing protein [Deltaproteobacteria bacterium]